MADVNVLVAIDAESFISTFGLSSANGYSATNPVRLDKSDSNHDPDKYIRMIVSEATHGITNEGTAELGFTAYTEDHILWRERSLSMDSDYAVLFYKFQPGGGDEVLDLPVRASRSVIEEPLPEKGPISDKWQPADWVKDLTDFYWTADASTPGNGSYTWWCSVYKRSAGIDPIGFFTWDPYIKVLEGPRPR